jgi:hypothetical protein
MAMRRLIEMITRRVTIKPLLTFMILTTSILFNTGTLHAKTVSTNPIKVTFISPDVKGNPYWDFVTNTMLQAANNFGIQLKVIHTNRHDLHDESILLTKLSKMEKPDYLIYVYQYNLGKRLLEFGEKNQINSFILNTNISEVDYKKIGRPTEKYKFWIGHSYADLSNISAHLSKKVYNLAKPLNNFKGDKNVYGIVLSGSRDTDVASQWNHGAIQADNELDDYQIKQIVYTNFNADKGYEKAKGLLQRYPEISVILSLDETVALSAIKAAEEVGRKPGEDIFIAGSASLLPTFKMMEEKKLVATYALSMWLGVHSIVYLYDQHLELNHSEKEFTYNYDDTVISTNQIPTYLKMISEDRWKNIDYRSFSYAFSPQLRKYDFSIQAFERAMIPVE